MNKGTLTLAGREYHFQPLKLGQIRRLLDAIEQLQGQTGGAAITASAEVIASVLSRDHPEMTVDALLDLEATIDEVTAAVGVVLEVAGLKAKGDQGEAPPAAD